MRSSRASPARTWLSGFARPGADGLTEVALDDGGVVYSVDEAVGGVEVAVYPWDVSISREPPRDSALNHVHGPISSLVVVGNRARIQVSGLVGEVTAASVQRLGPRRRATSSSRPSRLPRPVSSSGPPRRTLGRFRAVAVVTDREYGLFIGGESTEPASGDMRELVEPATGDPFARAALAGEADVDRAVEAARGALDGDGARRRVPSVRACSMRSRTRSPPTAPSSRSSRRGTSARRSLGEGGAPPGRRELPLLRLGDRDRSRGRSNPIGGSLLFYSLKEPVGVAAQIVPWNYPLMMATWKLAPALAAGCSVVLKPDPQTPLTAFRLAELATEVGFPAGVVNVVPGDGPTTGAYLVRIPAWTRSPSPARRRRAGRSCGSPRSR